MTLRLSHILPNDLLKLLAFWKNLCKVEFDCKSTEKAVFLYWP